MKQVLTTLLLITLCFGVSAQGWDSGDDGGDSWGDSGSDDGWGSDDGGDDSWGSDDGGDDSWGSDAGGDQSYDYGGSSGGDFGDSTGDDGWDDDGWDDDGGDYGSGFGDQEYVRGTRPKVVAKPYERFTGMPYDSTSELVQYVEVVEVIIPDKFFDLGGEPYDTPDSLEARAIRWMQLEFGEKEAKKMIADAGEDLKGREGNTVKALIVMPLIYEKNKYSKVNVGLIEFDMELRFKEGRYRYKFENFVHRTPAIAGTRGGKEDRTYLEYYLTAKRDVKSNDQILMACNNQMNKLIDGLKSSCDSTPFMDDDDW